VNVQDIDCIAVLRFVLLDQLFTILFRAEINFDESDLSLATGLLVDIILRLLHILLLLWKVRQSNIRTLKR
jgi:hypothetical protein